MFADLHIHTNSSDGTWDIYELLEIIKSHDISLFSITDHDTIDNSVKMLSEIHNYLGEYIIGTEIASTWSGKEYHITAYGFDHENIELNQLLTQNQEIRLNRNNRIIKDLIKKYFELSYPEYLDYDYDRKRGGWKPLNYMIDKGIIRNLDGYYKLVNGMNSNKTIFTSPENVIETVKNAGGFPFLAHPSANYNIEIMPEMDLKAWIDMGISGIECYSSYSNGDDTINYVKFCRKNKLMVSGGSDCHGTFLPKKVGVPKIRPEMIELLLKNRQNLPIISY